MPTCWLVAMALLLLPALTFLFIPAEVYACQESVIFLSKLLLSLVAVTLFICFNEIPKTKLLKYKLKVEKVRGSI